MISFFLFLKLCVSLWVVFVSGNDIFLVCYFVEFGIRVFCVVGFVLNDLFFGYSINIIIVV